MIRSMTGFGKALAELDGQFISVEVSSVNHRFLDCSVRTPYGWNSFEPLIRQAAKQHAARGKFNVTLIRRRGPSAAAAIMFSEEAAKKYVDASKALSALLGTDETLSLDVLAQLEGVFSQEEPEEDLEALESTLQQLLDEAFTGLNEMRLREGTALAKDLQIRIHTMRDALSEIELRLPEISAAYEARLKERIQGLVEDVAITEDRLAIEVAIQAEKSDVNEEIVRLKAHFERAESLFASREPVGRKLDFISQEIQREINTLGVKARDVGVTEYVLLMKSEQEKLREQIQNVE